MKYFDIGTIVVIVTTFLLFVGALFFTGFTHDVLLEAGVFLVSVKIIMMSYKVHVLSNNIYRDLEEIKHLLKKGR